MNWIRRVDLEVLTLSVAVLAAALILDVDSDDGGRLILAGLPLPLVCPFRWLVGLRCPLCGLSRAFVLAAHGRAGQAFASHRLWPLIFAALAAQVPYRLWRLARRPTPRRLPRRLVWCAVAVLAALVVANWIYEVAGGGARVL